MSARYEAEYERYQNRHDMLMTCNEVLDFLNDYLDGALPWRQRLAFNLHILLCRHCRRYLASYLETMRLTRTLENEPSSQLTPVPEELLQAILAARRADQGAATDDNNRGKT